MGRIGFEEPQERPGSIAEEEPFALVAELVRIAVEQEPSGPVADRQAVEQIIALEP